MSEGLPLSLNMQKNLDKPICLFHHLPQGSGVALPICTGLLRAADCTVCLISVTGAPALWLQPWEIKIHLHTYFLLQTTFALTHGNAQMLGGLQVGFLEAVLSVVKVLSVMITKPNQ